MPVLEIKRPAKLVNGRISQSYLFLNETSGNVEPRTMVVEDSQLRSVTYDLMIKLDPIIQDTVSNNVNQSLDEQIQKIIADNIVSVVDLSVEDFSSDFSEGKVSFQTSKDYMSGTLTVYCNGLNITLDVVETGKNTFSIRSEYLDISEEGSTLFAIFVGSAGRMDSGAPISEPSEISLSSFSARNFTPGESSLSYNPSSGVFTYVPPDLSSLSTFSGDYNDLSNTPDLSIYSTFSGDYNDLSNTPDLSIYSTFSGDYNDLLNTPDLSIYSTFSGDYNDLSNAPDLSIYSTFSGDYADLLNTPLLFSGDYNDLLNTPDLSIYSTFSGDYADLLNTPLLFSGDYNDLLNAPLLFSGDYADLSNPPAIPSDISDLSDSLGLLSFDGATIIPSSSSETIGDSNNFWGAIFSNRLSISQGISESFYMISGATSVVTHDCFNGQIFYHTGASSNFTVNLINLSLSSGYATNITIVISQGSTPYIPSSLQIDSSSKNILWQGGIAPNGTSGGTDVISFSIINNSGSYTILGQLVGFA